MLIEKFSISITSREIWKHFKIKDFWEKQLWFIDQEIDTKIKSI